MINNNKNITFKIDEVKYTVDNPSLKGKELKELANLSLDERLVIEIKGKPDIEVDNEMVYQVDNGMKFYSSKYVPKLKIEIDGNKYEIDKCKMTGKELKQLANIPLDGYKLIKEVRNGQDVLIEDNIVYDIDDKDIFFAMPIGITNGGSNNVTITNR